MALPMDVRDLYRFGKQVTKDRDKPVALAVLVEMDAPEVLLEAAREAFRPRTAQARVDVEMVDEGTPPLAAGLDAVILLVGGGGETVADTAKDLRAKHVPVVALALAESLGDLDYALGMPTEDMIVGEDVEDVVSERLPVWLADRLGGKRLALASNLPFTRHAVAHEIVKTTAFQNTLIGVVAVLPGTDMPLMTANQAKMFLQLASAYGQSIGTDRLRELVAVVGGGFLLRSIARQALTAVPGFGWLVKGGVAYAGTMTMGRAAIAWFEEGADLHEITARLKGLRSGTKEVLEVEAVVVDETSEKPGSVQQTLEIGPADEAP